MSKKRIYIATPVNARKEKTFEEKKRMAACRVEFLKMILHEDFPDAELLTSFDVCPLDEKINECVAMGRCIAHLLTADAIYLDHAWQSSKGCNLEYRAAKIYDKQIMEHDKM